MHHPATQPQRHPQVISHPQLAGKLNKTSRTTGQFSTLGPTTTPRGNQDRVDPYLTLRLVTEASNNSSLLALHLSSGLHRVQGTSSLLAASITAIGGVLSATSAKLVLLDGQVRPIKRLSGSIQGATQTQALKVTDAPASLGQILDSRTGMLSGQTELGNHNSLSRDHHNFSRDHHSINKDPNHGFSRDQHSINSAPRKVATGRPPQTESVLQTMFLLLPNRDRTLTGLTLSEDNSSAVHEETFLPNRDPRTMIALTSLSRASSAGHKQDQLNSKSLTWTRSTGKSRAVP